MKGKVKGKARGKGGREQEVNEESKQIIQRQLNNLVIRKRILEPIPEASTSHVNTRTQSEPPSTICSINQRLFAKAFYSKNERKKPKIQNIFIAQNFKPKDKIISRSRLNNRTDLEETLMILKSFELQMLSVKEKLLEDEIKKCKVDGFRINPHERVKLGNVETVLKGIRSDYNILRDQLTYFNKTNRRRLNVNEDSVDACILIDLHGENFADSSKRKSSIKRVFVPTKTLEQIKMEFRGAFYVNIIPDLEGVYSCKNTGDKAKEPTPAGRKALQLCDILSRLLQIMEVNALCKDGLNMRDRWKIICSKLERIYCGVIANAARAERRFSLHPSKVRIIVNAEGKNIADEELKPYMGSLYYLF